MKKALSRKNLWASMPAACRSGISLLLRPVPLAWLLGGRFRRQYAFIEQAQWWSREAGEAYQLARLKQVLALAWEKTAFYRRLFESVGFHPSDLKSLADLRGLPTIDKHVIRAHRDEMCAFSPDSSGIDYVSTGGTSGPPLEFYAGRNRSATEYAYLVKSWSRCGYRLGMATAVFRGRSVPEDKKGLRHEYDPILNHHYYSNFHMTEENIGRYLEHLAGIGECFLHVYPSSALAIAQFMYRNKIPAFRNVRGLIAESETVYPDQRAFIEQVFGRRMIASYGHSEKLILAAECEHSRDYHVWPTYGYCELLDAAGEPVSTPGQRGELVGTGFINTVMPFIRYRTGDHAVYMGHKCAKCGREHMILSEVDGRWPAGALVARDGSLISMTALNVHDDTLGEVSQYQFFQEAPGAAILRVAAARALGGDDLRRIEQGIGAKLAGRLQLSVQQVEKIELTGRGKLMLVDQRIKSPS